jgi:hypothetical protein
MNLNYSAHHIGYEWLAFTRVFTICSISHSLKFVASTFKDRLYELALVPQLVDGSRQLIASIGQTLQTAIKLWY